MHALATGAHKRNEWTLTDWLAWIESQHPKDIDFTLSRPQKIAEQLECLEITCPVITVAGTNGKGSTIAGLNQVLTALGYRVAAYTSPHIHHFNERLSINNVPVSDKAWIQAFTRIAELTKEDPLTFFEYTTLAAFSLIKNSTVDYCLLEIGLGGRLDCVNLIAPDIAVITGIAMDHTDFLGDTIEAIAAEKAGIIREYKPVVIGTSISATPRAIKNKVEQCQAPVYFAKDDFFWETGTAQQLIWQGAGRPWKFMSAPHLPLRSLGLCLKVLELLEITMTEQQVGECAQQLSELTLFGRFSVYLQDNKTYIFDVAHNEESVTELFRRVAAWQQANSPSGKIHAVLGKLKNKSFGCASQDAVELVSAWYLADLNVARGNDAKSVLYELGQDVDNKQLNNASCFQSVAQAFSAANAFATSGDIIVVFGSFHTIEQAITVSQFE